MIKIEDLKTRQFELIIDKSGSMQDKDCPGNLSRWKASEELAFGLALKMIELTGYGPNVTLFSNKLKVYEQCSGAEIRNIFLENEPFGGTNLAAAIEHRATAWLKSGRIKPLTMVVVTDGAPDSQIAVVNTITEITHKIHRDEDVGILFLQVGKEKEARAFLKKLDDDLEKGGAKFDIVSSKTCDEIENSSLTEALLDAVNA